MTISTLRGTNPELEVPLEAGNRIPDSKIIEEEKIEGDIIEEVSVEMVGKVEIIIANGLQIIALKVGQIPIQMLMLRLLKATIPINGIIERTYYICF